MVLLGIFVRSASASTLEFGLRSASLYAQDGGKSPICNFSWLTVGSEDHLAAVIALGIVPLLSAALTHSEESVRYEAVGLIYWLAQARTQL